MAESNREMIDSSASRPMETFSDCPIVPANINIFELCLLNEEERAEQLDNALGWQKDVMGRVGYALLSSDQLQELWFRRSEIDKKIWEAMMFSLFKAEHNGRFNDDLEPRFNETCPLTGLKADARVALRDSDDLSYGHTLINRFAAKDFVNLHAKFEGHINLGIYGEDGDRLFVPELNHDHSETAPHYSRFDIENPIGALDEMDGMEPLAVAQDNLENHSNIYSLEEGDLVRIRIVGSERVRIFANFGGKYEELSEPS